MFFVH